MNPEKESRLQKMIDEYIKTENGIVSEIKILESELREQTARKKILQEMMEDARIQEMKSDHERTQLKKIISEQSDQIDRMRMDLDD